MKKGKLKSKKLKTIQRAEVEILIHLPPGVSPDKTIDALYAFTACETSVAPLGCVIENHKPRFYWCDGYVENINPSYRRFIKA